jgi:hypothetical protein
MSATIDGLERNLEFLGHVSLRSLEGQCFFIGWLSSFTSSHRDGD